MGNEALGVKGNLARLWTITTQQQVSCLLCRGHCLHTKGLSVVKNDASTYSAGS